MAEIVMTFDLFQFNLGFFVKKQLDKPEKTAVLRRKSTKFSQIDFSPKNFLKKKPLKMEGSQPLIQYSFRW